jgi:hypothetical protein
VLGPEFRESELCGEAVFFDGLYSSPECINPGVFPAFGQTHDCVIL